MTRGFGFRFDRPEYRRKSFGLLAGRYAEPREQYSLTEHIPRVLDQGSTNTCVAHATASGLAIGGAAQGRPLPFHPSPRDLYRLSLRLDRRPGEDSAPVVDEGTEPGLVEQVVRQWGITPIGTEGQTDCNPETINNDPSLLTIEKASHNLVAGAYLIGTSGTALCRDIRKAIDSDFPVGVGCYADAKFMDGTETLTAQDRGYAKGGWHYVLIVGHYPGRVVGLNSWGRSWGWDGMFEATDDWLSQCVSCYAYAVHSDEAAT